MTRQLGELSAAGGNLLGRVPYTIDDFDEAPVRGEFIWDGSVNILRNHGCFSLRTRSGRDLHIQPTRFDSWGDWPNVTYSVDFAIT